MPRVQDAWRRGILERMQSRRSRVTEQAIPNRSSDADHAGQLTFREAEPDRSLQPADIGKKISDCADASVLDLKREKDRRLGNRGEDRLGFRCRHRALHRFAGVEVNSDR